MQRFCFTLDLINDERLMREYEQYHLKIWPEIERSILDAGVLSMQIYRFSNRLFMIMDTTDEFSLEDKKASDRSNSKVQEWEELMWKYQQALPQAKPGEKWMLMRQIFEISA